MLSGNASLAVLCFAELSLYLSEEKLFVTNFSSMSTGKFFQLAAQFTLPRCISEWQKRKSVWRSYYPGITVNYTRVKRPDSRRFTAEHVIRTVRKQSENISFCVFWQEPWRGILKIVSCQFLINVVAQNLDLPLRPPLPHWPICPPPPGRWEAELRGWGQGGGSGWDTELHSLVLIYNRVKCWVLGDNAAYRQDMVSTRCHQPSLLTLLWHSAWIVSWGANGK